MNQCSLSAFYQSEMDNGVNSSVHIYGNINVSVNDNVVFYRRVVMTMY